MKKCALHSLGCKVNSYETQALQKLMEESGYEIVPFGSEPADVYIINTCSVTNIADRKSRQMIHKARKLNPFSIIAATGCYVESSMAGPDEDIDIAVGNGEKSRLPELIENYTKHTGCSINGAVSDTSAFDEMCIDKPLEHTRAYVKIQDGCNRFCSYCIIPYVRGRIRSREYCDIIDEVQRIADSGCRETVITGIHLSSYGMDKPEDFPKLIDVIEGISMIDGIDRIRLGSLEPTIITEDFMERLVKCTKICPHFHVSLQSGCNETLKRMNRKYTSEEYRQGINLIRKYFADASITTDVIVGFPGETDEEFECTRRFLEEMNFYELHVFKYSRRKGTLADKMQGQVTQSIKNQRSAALLELDEGLSRAYREGYIGRKARVLLEENRIINGRNYITGFTDTYVRVSLDNEKGTYKTNDIIDVQIEKLFDKDMVIGVAEK